MRGFRSSAIPGAPRLRPLLVLSIAAGVTEAFIVGLVLVAFLTRSGQAQLPEQLLLALALLGLGLIGWLSYRLHHGIVLPIAALQLAVDSIDPESVDRAPLPRTPEIASLATSVDGMLDRLSVDARLVPAEEARLRTLFAHSADVIFIIGNDTLILSATPSSGQLLGVGTEHLAHRRLCDLVTPEDRPIMLAALSGPPSNEPVQFRLIHATGRLITTETRIVDLTADPSVQGLVLTMRDVSERKRLEGKLSHRAFHDALTGLPNRALLRDRLAHSLLRRDPDQPLALLFIDLNGFKTVNDSLGHSVGDELLQTVAARLELHLRAGDTAARIGGDEFVILLEHADETEAMAAAHRVSAALDEPATMSGVDVYPGGSIGVAVSTAAITSADELLAHADAAMYLAKAQESGHICLYDQDLSRSVLRRLELKADLQRAVQRGEIEVDYQAIIDLKTNQLSGVEALARWLHPVIGQLLPADFISLAEQTGLIVQVGRDVLDQACKQFRYWQERYGELAPGFLTVNISGRELREPLLVSRVAGAIGEHHIRPDQLILEITESVLFANNEPVLERLCELKQLGVRLAIDDFGTGHSSLADLQHLPVDFLKLDRPFVNALKSQGGSATAVARAIIDLGHHLGLHVIAEGVETERQAAQLHIENCDYGQGYLFGHPGSAKQVSAMLVSAQRTRTGTGTLIGAAGAPAARER